MAEAMLEHYGLKRDEVTGYLHELQRQLASSSVLIEQGLSRYITLYQYAFVDPDGSVSLKATIEILGTAVRDPAFLAHQHPVTTGTSVVESYTTMSNRRMTYMTILPDKAYEWGMQFLQQVLREVRLIVCTRSKEYARLRKEAGSYPKAFSVAVSAGVMNALGVTSPMALGIATLVLLAFAQATKNAFCKMTNGDVLRAIGIKVATARAQEREAIKKAFGKHVKLKD